MWVWELGAPWEYQAWKWFSMMLVMAWYTYLIQRYITLFFIKRGWWPKHEMMGVKPLSKPEIVAMDGWPALLRMGKKSFVWFVVWGLTILSSVEVVDRYLRPSDGAILKQKFALEAQQRQRQVNEGYPIVGEYGGRILYQDDYGDYRWVEPRSVTRVDVFLGPPPWESSDTKQRVTYIRGEDLENPILETKWGPI